MPISGRDMPTRNSLTRAYCGPALLLRAVQAGIFQPPRLGITSEVSMTTFSAVFSNPSGPTYTLGPLKQLYLRGHVVREFHDGPVLAQSDNYRWIVDGGKYSRFDCDTECNVTLARDRDKARKTYGPFPGFSSLNGLKFVDHQLFCLY